MLLERQGEGFGVDEGAGLGHGAEDRGVDPGLFLDGDSHGIHEEHAGPREFARGGSWGIDHQGAAGF